jgi:cardiolipin synthase A/B
VTHEKSLVVDSTCVLVATFNLSDKNFTETRDYGVVSYAVPGVEQQRESRQVVWV